MDPKRGFSLVELLIVIAVLSILIVLVSIGVQRAKIKAHDNRIRNAVGQLRWQAEIVYDGSGASYQQWATNPPANIAPQLEILRQEINDNYGNDEYPNSDVVTILDDQRKEYCISAPLRSEPGRYYCVDATAVFKTVSAPCTDDTLNPTAPNRCPST